MSIFLKHTDEWDYSVFISLLGGLSKMAPMSPGHHEFHEFKAPSMDLLSSASPNVRDAAVSSLIISMIWPNLLESCWLKTDKESRKSAEQGVYLSHQYNLSYLFLLVGKIISHWETFYFWWIVVFCFYIEESLILKITQNWE